MQPLSKKSIILPFLIGLYLMVLVFFVAVLKYDFLRSDVLGYWRESLTWTMPFHEHPPLYAWMIALVRTLTLNFFPPAADMIAINLLAFGCCIFLVMVFFHNAGVGPGYAALAALLFGLWPFVGLTYTVVPVADIPAIALTLAGLVLLQRSRYAWAALFFGLAIVTHKGVWPVIGLVVLADFYRRREYFSKRNLIFPGIMLLPLTVLWVAGASYHHSANWLMERSMRVNTSMGGGYLVLDGLLGTFEEGGLKGIVKGSIVLFFLGLAAATLISSFYLKYRHYEAGYRVCRRRS